MRKLSTAEIRFMQALAESRSGQYLLKPNMNPAPYKTMVDLGLLAATVKSGEGVALSLTQAGRAASTPIN